MFLHGLPLIHSYRFSISRTNRPILASFTCACIPFPSFHSISFHSQLCKVKRPSAEKGHRKYMVLPLSVNAYVSCSCAVAKELGVADHLQDSILASNEDCSTEWVSLDVSDPSLCMITRFRFRVIMNICVFY